MVQDDNITVIGQGYHALYHNIQVRRAYGYGVASGGAVSPGSDGGLSVDVTSGTAVHAGNEESIPAQSSLALNAADSTDPRKDIVVYSGGGTVEIITGTPNPVHADQPSATRFETYQPSPPDGTGGDYVVLAEVWVPAGASTLNSADINDLRTDPAIDAHGVSLTDDVVASDGTVLLDDSEGQVGDGAVDTASIQKDAVTSPKIASEAVGASQISQDAVGSYEIDNSILPQVLDSGTFTHTGGSYTEVTLAGVVSGQLDDFDLDIGVDSAPSWNADYAFNWDVTRKYDAGADQTDLELILNWDIDPGAGNDLTLDYRVIQT